MPNKKGKYDSRNKLNNLTGKEWLKLTKSFWESESCKLDKKAFDHPAPFLVKDVQKLIKMFTKKELTVLDPFCGSGTTLLAAGLINRNAIGIDLNEKYKKLAIERLEEQNISSELYKYIIGDSLNLLKDFDHKVDYIVTSPPYHNILKNKGQGIRKENDNYRNGARTGVDYYTDRNEDLGNQDTYEDFLKELKKIFRECYKILEYDKYMTVIMSDFTVNKKEVCVQGDVVKLMEDLGFKFAGTTVLLQNKKPLYPFGYPYAYKINHHHQNLMNFRKRDY
ncbi:TRM11 family SAM-dependent methyltransferase [Halanaerobium polyolivorans]|uniref:TRM11 family SAM-dependent methyltransferase n=1 Tax=Halanaerobium polyolivorans TaxID=2886943 RepID=UPI002105B58B|nr:site-specific DNA-methyltransferase [Halanaerobium polyolivorans]